MPEPKPPPGPRPERRKHRRLSPGAVKVWLVSGEFDELYTTVNFGRRLLNVGPWGCCLETTGRLRPDVLMSVELRFEEVNGSLRGQARAVWTNTITQGGQEIHLAGFRFEEPPEATQTVRDLLSGARPTMIMAQKSRDYEDLKRKAEERKQAPPKRKAGAVRKTAFLLLVLALVYVGGFWALVFRGRLESPGPEIRYRYLPGAGADEGERRLAALFHPAYVAFRAAGADLVYVPP